MARILDGKELAREVRASVREGVEELVSAGGPRPGLAAVLVGDDPASRVYVGTKEKACAAVGMESRRVDLPADVTGDELRREVLRLGDDPAVHGILVQLPLPDGVSPRPVIEAIPPEKDVDGLHPVSQGRLLAGDPGLRPCTPLGVMALLELADSRLEGANAVIVGRSLLVGKPVGLLLLEKNATVTTCHSRTRNLEEIVRGADVLVVAMGRPRGLPGSWVREGSVVIDVGIHRTDSGLIGDVEFDEAAKRAAAITPVPGGVGPMTVAMLLRNTLEAASRQSAAKAHG